MQADEVDLFIEQCSSSVRDVVLLKIEALPFYRAASLRNANWDMFAIFGLFFGFLWGVSIFFGQ